MLLAGFDTSRDEHRGTTQPADLLSTLLIAYSASAVMVNEGIDARICGHDRAVYDV
ncbi:MAG: hypothetical protein U0X92_19230 [Anaerolineales bacterium]